ncbi:hypothetical protein SLS57_005384 [Botryosphaeria dothidea]
MSTTTFKQYYLPEKKCFHCLTLRDIPEVHPKAGQILVRLKAVSLNWRDCVLAVGTYPFPGPDVLVPGSDGAGIVEEVGEGVADWQAGDGVLANSIQDQVSLTQLGSKAQGLLGEYHVFPHTGAVPAARRAEGVDRAVRPVARAAGAYVLRRSLHKNVGRGNGDPAREAPTKRRRKSSRDQTRDFPSGSTCRPLKPGRHKATVAQCSPGDIGQH